MDKKDQYLIIIGIVICIVIACLSPYIASGNPDGLEKSAEDSGLPEDYSIENVNAPESPLPDYAFASNPDNQGLQIVALIIGIIVTLALGYVVGEIVRNRN